MTVARAARALGGRRRTRCRSSTCASTTSGTPATSPARSTSPTTTSTPSPTASTPQRPVAVDLRLRPALGGRREPAAAPTAPSDVIHVVDGGVPLWKREGWPIEQPDAGRGLTGAAGHPVRAGHRAGRRHARRRRLRARRPRPRLRPRPDRRARPRPRRSSSSPPGRSPAGSATRAPAASAGATPARSPRRPLPGIVARHARRRGGQRRAAARRLRARDARRRRTPPGARPTTTTDPDDERWERGGACPPLRLPRDLVAGAAVGLVTGFFGVGGGFLIVPTLAIALAFTMRTAVGTSLAIITATSLLGLAAHLLAGRSARPGDDRSR